MQGAVQDLDETLTRIARGEKNVDGTRALSAGGVRTLQGIASYLGRTELTIDAAERVEEVVKQTILEVAASASNAEAAHDLCVVMKRIGFVHKLKSYAVKAASPLGYSVFFQRPNEGFSFQRHISHKIEIFHILSAPPGGYALVCDYDSWAAVYEPARFQRWIDGATDANYECFRHVPEPGDMIVIDRLNVVHTVIGCVLEEFATISTDMVDRLFDQNVGRPIPPEFTRDRVNGLLAALPEVEPRRIFEVGSNGLVQRPANVESYAWGEVRRVTIGPLTARHLLVQPNASTDVWQHETDSSALFVRAGHGTLLLETRGQSAPPIELKPGELTLVPARVGFRLRSNGSSPLRVSQQCLPLATAFNPE